MSDTGTPQGIVNYDPWGQVQSGTVPTWGFTGELQQGANVYLRARWYNTQRGSFTSTDPFAGTPEQPYSQHPYQYGYSNPVAYTDPTGRCVFAGIDTLVCAGVAITVYEAIMLLIAAGVATWSMYQSCIVQHGCDRLAADLQSFLDSRGSTFDTNTDAPPVASAPHGMPEPAPTPVPFPTAPEQKGGSTQFPLPSDCPQPVVQPGPQPLPPPSTPLASTFPKPEARGVIILEAASIKQLKLALGRVGVPTRKYSLRKATNSDLEQMRRLGWNVDAPYKPGQTNAWGYTPRDGAGNFVLDSHGRPVIVFTPLGLSSLEAAVKTFGHESQHIKDWIRGRDEAFDINFEKRAEDADEELWRLIQRSRE